MAGTMLGTIMGNERDSSPSCSCSMPTLIPQRFSIFLFQVFETKQNEKQKKSEICFVFFFLQ